MQENNGISGFIFQIVKGGFTALITALVAVFIFAGVVKFASLNVGVIKAVNQFIKVLAVFLGCFFWVRESKGLIKGAIVGLVSATLISLSFLLISSEAGLGAGFVLDLLFMAVIGAISGIISVNIKN